MFQVVIGMHVAEVFEESEKFLPNKDGGQDGGQGEGQKMSPEGDTVKAGQARR